MLMLEECSMTIKSYTDAMRYLMLDNQLMLDLEYFGDDDKKHLVRRRSWSTIQSQKLGFLI